MGLLNPFALIYLALISLVVLIYFFNRRSNIVYVPSIIPWRELKTEVVRARMFRIDPIFLLQVLLIILLSLFIARPYTFSDIFIIHGANKVVLIDSSASMQTLEADGSRLDMAKDYASKLIDKMRPGDKMMIISTYSSSEVTHTLTGDKNALKRHVHGLKPTETGTDIEGGISLALSYMEGVKNGQLYVLTDQPIENCGKKIAGLDPQTVRFIRLGKSSSNVAITSLDIFQDVFNKKDEAYISLKNFSEEAKAVKLNIKLLAMDSISNPKETGQGTNRINEKTLMEKGFNLKAGEQRSLTVRNISSAQGGILKAQIETDDSLKADNTAYGIIKERKGTINILLVTNNNAFKTEFQRLQAAFNQIHIDTISPDTYTSDSQRDFDIGIFHGFFPDEPPRINSLFIAPIPFEDTNEDPALKTDENEQPRPPPYHTDGLKAFTSHRGFVDDVQILDWDNRHPAMRYMDYLDNIIIGEAALMEPPRDAEVLIYASGRVNYSKKDAYNSGSRRNDLPLAFATQLEGKKAILLGFDLAGFNYSDNNNLPILIMTLNIIQWLSPLGDKMMGMEGTNLTNGDQVKTGSQYINHNPKGINKVSMIRHDGDISEVPDISPFNQQPSISGSQSQAGNPKSETTTSFLIKHTGIYIVNSKDGDTVFVANLFDESESDIKPRTSAAGDPKAGMASIRTTAGGGYQSTSFRRQEKNEISRYVLYLIPLLLFAEWVYSFVKRK